MYAVVVASKKNSVSSGRYLEKVGFYSPASTPKFFFLNFARVSY